MSMSYVRCPEPVTISCSLSVSPQPSALEVGVQKAALVISGPSGVGKSTIIDLLKQEFPDKFGFSVSHTTRSPRPGEVDGVDYHFTTREAMVDLLSEGHFLESAEVHGNLYGTSYDAVDYLARDGKMCILDIDVQGAATIRRNQKIDALFVFVEPPSLNILEERLRGRQTDDEETISRRVMNAQEEIERSKEEGLFDHTITNDNVLTAYQKLKLIVSENWARLDEPLKCHMDFESYDTTDSVARSMLRFACSSSSSATLKVPRGKTMVKATVERGFIYRAQLCCSDTQFTLGDIGDVLLEDANRSHSVFRGIVPTTGTVDASSTTSENDGEWGLLSRKIFSVVQLTPLEAELKLSNQETESCAVLAFVDNDTGKENVYLSGKMPRTVLQPNVNGYSIMTYYQGLKMDTANRGEWKLSIISDSELNFTELPEGSSVQLNDKYSPNKRALLCSYNLTGSVHQVLSMHFSITCDSRAVFNVVLTRKDNNEVIKEWNELTNACTFLGIPLNFDQVELPSDAASGGNDDNDAMGSSTYTISIFLSRDSCPFKIQPAGAISVPLSWRLQLEAPFDLLVTKDDTMEKQFAATLATWNDMGVGGPDKRPATAKAALEKFMEEQAESSAVTEDVKDESQLQQKGITELNGSRFISGVDTPLELNKDASFTIRRKDVREESTMNSFQRLLFDETASLYVPQSLEAST